MPITKKNDEGKDVPTRFELPYTNEYCHFITYQNMKVIDALHYLFAYGIGENGLNTPAYLLHNLMEDKGYITSFENLLKPSSLAEMPQITAVPFSITEGELKDPEFMMKAPQVDSFNGGIENAKMFFNYRFAEYDQEERLWESYDINKLVLNDLLTKGIDNSAESSTYMKILKEDIQMSKYYKFVPHSHMKLYDMMRALELYSSSISFIVNGSMALDVGHVITIKEDGENGGKTSQFSGKWIVKTIKHTFKESKYLNYITACRRYKRIHISAADNTAK